MGLNYDKSKKREEEGGSQWASYSDLFMVLSFVFLLLYVVSSLQTSTYTIKQQLEFKRLSDKAEDLARQVKVYDTLKSDYLKKKASTDEKKTYKKLMAQLELIKSQKQAKRDQLKAKIAQSEKDEASLNQYQQIIRNIINANVVAKSRIVKRNEIIKDKSADIENQKKVIVNQDETISQKKIFIQNLNSQINSKSDEIKQNKAFIANLRSDVETKIAKIHKLHQDNKTTKEQMDQQIAQISAENSMRIKDIQNKNAMITHDLKQQQSQLEKEKTQIAQTLSETENNYRKVASTLETTTSQLSESKSQNTELAKDLERMKKLASARGNLAKSITRALNANGLGAKVNAKTGEVTINFDEYFDTGKYRLKDSMKSTLKKFIPLYAKSLFEQKEIARQIKSVEIIGFASPTYKGKLLDPSTLRPEDRAGVDFNLNLSFYRARSIFKYIFNTANMTYLNQKKLQKFIKVTGRSFLSEQIKGRNIAAQVSRKQFCKKNNCKKSQKVVIKFNIE